MKKINLLLLGSLFFVLGACQKEMPVDADGFNSTVLQNQSKVEKNGKKVTVPFKAKFYTTPGEGSGIDTDACGGEFCFLNYQVGPGQATHMGKIDTRVVFCVRLPEGCDQEYPGFPIIYQQAKGTMVAANGDELHTELDGIGKLFPTDKPGYIFEFQDDHIITGGTGRFEGASGLITSDSYNRGDTTDHVFEGYISY